MYFTIWMEILFWGLLLSLSSFTIIRLSTNSAVRHEVEAAISKWSRVNGRAFPFAEAEVVNVWHAHRRLLTLRVARNLSFSGLCAVAAKFLFEQSLLSEVGVQPGEASYAWLLQAGAWLALGGCILFVVRAVLVGRRPSAESLLAELQSDATLQPE